ncbi:MAG: hypothetical protein JW837_02885 [Sedimentisphaerales bacterium]|nr:hypothetical protein [Sedimentisphaerales bacterium]
MSFAKGIALKRFLFLTLLAVFLILSSCRKSSNSERNPDEVVLINQLRAKVQLLDPANIKDASTHTIGAELFDPLYRYHYLKRPYEIIPELAAELPTISDDGLVYTIPIKKGVLFHDNKCFPDGKGKEVKACDFVYSWKRIADIKTRSVMWWLLDGRVVGLDEFREYSKTCKSAEEVDYSRPVEGLYAADDYTIVIKLKRPWPQILLTLAYLPTSVVAKEAVDYYGKNIVNNPVGTGPFMLKVRRRGSYIEMVKNPNYRVDLYPSEGEEGDAEKGLLADAGKKMPFVDRIIWRIIEEEQPRWFMFQKGMIDITSIPKDNFGMAMASMTELTPEMKERNIQFLAFQEPDTFWVGFNHEDPLLGKNKALRLAISYAIDRERYNKLFNNGRGKIAYGFIPPNMPGYDENIKEISHSRYDPEKAKEYLKQAIEINGGPIPELKMMHQGTNTTYMQMGEFFEKCFEGIGLEVENEYFDFPTYLEKLRIKNYQINTGGWIADWPDVANFLQIYYSKNAPWPNSTNYSNPEFDKIYEQVIEMPDSPERTELYRKAQRIVVEDVAVAYNFHRIWYVMHHDWVENIKPNAYYPECNGFGFCKYYRVNTQKRQAYREKYK